MDGVHSPLGKGKGMGDKECPYTETYSVGPLGPYQAQHTSLRALVTTHYVCISGPLGPKEPELTNLRASFLRKEAHLLRKE